MQNKSKQLTGSEHQDFRLWLSSTSIILYNLIELSFFKKKWTPFINTVPYDVNICEESSTIRTVPLFLVWNIDYWIITQVSKIGRGPISYVESLVEFIIGELQGLINILDSGGFGSLEIHSWITQQESSCSRLLSTWDGNESYPDNSSSVKVSICHFPSSQFKYYWIYSGSCVPFRLNVCLCFQNKIIAFVIYINLTAGTNVSLFDLFFVYTFNR